MGKYHSVGGKSERAVIFHPEKQQTYSVDFVLNIVKFATKIFFIKLRIKYW